MGPRKPDNAPHIISSTQIIDVYQRQEHAEWQIECPGDLIEQLRSNRRHGRFREAEASTRGRRHLTFTAEVPSGGSSRFAVEQSALTGFGDNERRSRGMTGFRLISRKP